MASQNGNGEINMTWLWIILAFIAGGAFGVVMMCCFIVASQEDERLEKLDTDNAEDLNTLSRGIYIINNRKVIVR